MAELGFQPRSDLLQSPLVFLTGEGNGNPLQYSCLENPKDGGAWWAAVHGVSKGQTQLSDFTFTFHFHALEKEMATHSSTFAWKIPWMAELGAGHCPWGRKESGTTEQLHSLTRCLPEQNQDSAETEEGEWVLVGGFSSSVSPARVSPLLFRAPPRGSLPSGTHARTPQPPALH